MRRSLYCLIILAITLFGCARNAPEQQAVHVQNFASVAPNLPINSYTITEDFETSQKSNYKQSDVKLITGNWTFKDALIGEDSSDVKSGHKSVRLRTGFIAMNFDLAGVKKISIKHAKCGTDANSQWQLYFSVDSGTTYLPLGPVIHDLDTAFHADSFSFNVN